MGDSTHGERTFPFTAAQIEAFEAFKRDPFQATSKMTPIEPARPVDMRRAARAWRYA